MDNKALDKANIDNLTALWQVMGTRADSGIAGMRASIGWPNRWWFDWSKAPYAPGDDLLARLPPEAMVPLWAADESNNPRRPALVRAGFAVCLEQRAMHFSLDDLAAAAAGELQLSRVVSSSQVESWTDVCSRAFGYPIDVAVIRRVAEDSAGRLLQAHIEDKVVATALLFKTGTVIGVHQVGVPPEFRGRGIAEGLMKNALIACREWGAALSHCRPPPLARGCTGSWVFTHGFESIAIGGEALPGGRRTGW